MAFPAGALRTVCYSCPWRNLPGSRGSSIIQWGCTLCFLNQFMRQGAWNMCLQQVPFISSSDPTGHRQITQSLSIVSFSFSLLLLFFKLIEEVSSVLLLKTSLQSTVGKNNSTSLSLSLFSEPGSPTCSELGFTKDEFLLTLRAMQQAATTKAMNSIPPRTPKTMANTLEVGASSYQTVRETGEVPFLQTPRTMEAPFALMSTELFCWVWLRENFPSAAQLKVPASSDQNSLNWMQTSNDPPEPPWLIWQYVFIELEDGMFIAMQVGLVKLMVVLFADARSQEMMSQRLPWNPMLQFSHWQILWNGPRGMMGDPPFWQGGQTDISWQSMVYDWGVPAQFIMVTQIVAEGQADTLMFIFCMRPTITLQKSMLDWLQKP